MLQLMRHENSHGDKDEVYSRDLHVSHVSRMSLKFNDHFFRDSDDDLNNDTIFKRSHVSFDE